jgi:type I restriction-modification system DNA methylase subunit
MGEDQLKRELAKVHKILRDTDGNSSLLERFDELTKLLFLKILSERDPRSRLFDELCEVPKQYSARIREAYATACESQPGLVPEKFRTLNLSNDAILKIGRALSLIHISSSKSDFKGLAYEEILKGTFEKGENQQFFTPRPITSFMVSLMRPFLTGVVGDPASGTGGFLTETVRHGISPAQIFGFEVDERLAWVTGINLLLNGATNFKSVYLGNGGTLGEKGRRLAGKFDAILTNPPFGSDFSDVAELAAYTLGNGLTSRRRGVLFIERCLHMLNPGGFLGIVIDEGVLALPSSTDVRQLILDQSDILAVINLPDTAFMPYASVCTSILLLRKKSKHAKSPTTFYARAEKIGRKPNGDPDVVFNGDGEAHPNSDLDRIITAWEEYQTTGSLASQSKDIFLSNTSKLLQDDGPDARIDYRYHHPSRLKAAAVLKASKYPLVSIGEVCIERNETLIPAAHLDDQTIMYTGLAHMESWNGVAHQVPTPSQSLKSGVRKYYNGDVLFARMRPNLRKVALIEFEKPGYTSSECFVFALRKGKDGEPIFDPYLLSVLLRSDFVFGQIVHLVAGIGRPRISIKDIRKIRIPLAPREHQMMLRKSYLKAEVGCKDLRHQAYAMLAKADKQELQAVENLADGLRG